VHLRRVRQGFSELLAVGQVTFLPSFAWHPDAVVLVPLKT
jgi:hypothetical protein